MKPIRIVAIIVATGVVFGGGVYMWQKSESNTQQDALNSQISTLQSQKDALEKSTTPTSSNTITPTQNSSSTSQPAVSNIFDLASAKVGDKVGKMSISKIEKYSDRIDLPLSSNNVKITFTGQVEVSGSYSYDEAGSEFAHVLQLSFTENSASQLPRLSTDPKYNGKSYVDRLEILNDVEAKTKLGIDSTKSSGNATIILENFLLGRCECDGYYNTASLVSASNVVDDIANWQNFSSKYFTLSFKIPPDFEVKESANNLLISRKPYEKFTASEDTAFLYLTRYGDTYTKEGQKNSYKNHLKDATESNVTIDGATFTKLVGFDNPADSNLYHLGKEIVVLLDKSWIQIVDRPNSKDADTKLYTGNSPTDLGSKILSTMKFSK